MGVVCTMWQALRGCTGPGRMDGVLGRDHPNKGKTPYVLVQGRATACPRHQPAWGTGEASDSLCVILGSNVCSGPDLADLHKGPAAVSQWSGSGHFTEKSLLPTDAQVSGGKKCHDVNDLPSNFSVDSFIKCVHWGQREREQETWHDIKGC